MAQIGSPLYDVSWCAFGEIEGWRSLDNNFICLRLHVPVKYQLSKANVSFSLLRQGWKGRNPIGSIIEARLQTARPAIYRR